MKSSLSLTERAGFTFLSQVLRQGAHLIVGFMVTPIVIHGLGAELYGAWSMIRQSVGYLSLSDLKPMGTLKLKLAVNQHRDDWQEKRRFIGSALLAWGCTLPIFLIAGGALIWKFPACIQVRPEYIRQVQWALIIVTLSVVINRILALPGNVLRGVNLEFKAMGLQACITLLNGGLLAGAIWAGWQLPGVAGASVLGIILLGLARLIVAKNALPWFGIAKPRKAEFIDFAKLSAWFTLSSLSKLFLTASDLLLIGFLLGPSAVAVYVTTRAALRLTMEPMGRLFQSASPGLIGICGRGDWTWAMNVRSEMFALAMAGMTFVGAAVLALNGAFIRLWVGYEYFGGEMTTLLLVLAEMSKLFFQIDNALIGGMLEIKRMALSMCGSGALVLLLGYGLISLWGLPGMACASFIGYLAQWAYYQHIIRQRSGVSLHSSLTLLLKNGLRACPVFVPAFWSGAYLPAFHEWRGFFSFAALVAFSLFAYVWFFLLASQERRRIVLRMKACM